jgi:hypothetical protein
MVRYSHFFLAPRITRRRKVFTEKTAYFQRDRDLTVQGERHYNSIAWPGPSQERSTMEIKNVGVVGFGIMGSGLAQVYFESGYDASSFHGAMKS